MNRVKKWKLAVTAAAAGLFIVACSEATKHPVAPEGAPAYTPSFGLVNAGNGPGACMGEDSYASGLTPGLASASGLNCTANDIALASATVTEYSFVSAAGPFTALAPGATISCTQGDTIYARTSAILETSATYRWDVGVWIATDGGDAVTGSCVHFNLIPGAQGVPNTDGDACGDMASANGLTTVPLDVLTLVCSDADGNDSLDVGACIGWQNQLNSTDPSDPKNRICPITPPGGALGFRYGTVPDNKAKCNCEPFQLPIDVLKSAKLEVRKVCAPTSDNGTFDLLIDGSNQFANNVACGGTTGSQTVTAGSTSSPGATHTFGEGDFTAANYTTSYSCVNRVGGASRGSGSSLGPNDITLQPDDDVVCTYTNTRKPTLTVNKVCAPTTDAGKFNLRIDGANAGTGADASCGGTTGAVVSTVGAHTVSETAGTGTNLSNYNSLIGGDCAADGSVSLAAGQNKVCTITNTRKPTLTVNKVCVPTSDTGKFNLRIDGSNAGTGADASCGGTTGAVEVTIGAHTVSETAGTGTNLGDYASLIGGDCAADGTVSLAAGQNKVCTITNTKKATLTVNKVCVPTSDTGKFNLRIDGANAGTGADASCGGTTGAVTVTATSHTVSETAGTGTSLTAYSSLIGGDCAADGTVTLSPGQNKVCTITNSRLPTFQVKKVCDPTTDAGRFDLRIKGSAASTNVACGGQTNAVIVAIGDGSASNFVGEQGNGSTNLSSFSTTLSCTKNGNLISGYPTGVLTPDGSGIIQQALGTTLAAGDVGVCTFTNTRKPTLTVNKVCAPTTDAGKFNLRIDGANAGTGADASCGGTTGAQVVTIGAHTVSETAGTGTDLNNYTTLIGGDCAADGSVSVAAGQNKVCTITNTRKPTLRVNKVCAPTTDPGKFNLRIDGANAGTGADASCGGTTGVVLSSVGAHTVSETGGTNTDLTNYVSAITGDCASNGSITLAAGQNAVCTITNSRKAVLIVDKVVTGGGTQQFEFTQTGISNFFLADATAPKKTTGLTPGNITVCELALAVAWNATATLQNGNGAPADVPLTIDGTTGDACRIIPVAYGDSLTFVVTNTPPPGGGTRTIGYWKNHASCATSNGGQYQRSIDRGEPEANLDFYLGGAGVQSIYPIGDITSLTCTEAVNLLSKNAKTGAKRAGDPIYNMVAQLLGAKLNVAASAGTCATLNTALAAAQAYLDGINFVGTGSYKGALSATDQNNVNTWAGIFGSYNEGTLGGGCPTHI